jgi:hypothetical protein
MKLNADVFLAYQYRSNQYLALLEQIQMILDKRKERDAQMEELLRFHYDRMK